MTKAASIIRTVLPCLAIGLVSTAVFARQDRLAPVDEELQTVDGRVEDVSVLSTSLRVNPLGLGLPAGFDKVYRVPGSTDMFMRGNGALYALFDQSVYSSHGGVSSAEVPPSTVFYIGGLPAELEASDPVDAPRRNEPERDQADHSDGVIHAGFGAVAPAGPDTGNRVTFPEVIQPGNGMPRFISDRAYRATRLKEIVNRQLGRPTRSP